jgi:hypothetical protein
MVRLTVYVPEDLKRWLQHRGIDEGRDVGQLVTDAIRAYRLQSGTAPGRPSR